MSPRQAAATALHYPVSIGGHEDTVHTICFCGAAWVCPEWRATVVVPEQRLSRTLVTVGLAWSLIVGGLSAAFSTPLSNPLACLLLPALVGGLLVLASRLGAL